MAEHPYCFQLMYFFLEFLILKMSCKGVIERFYIHLKNIALRDRPSTFHLFLAEDHLLAEMFSWSHFFVKFGKASMFVLDEKHDKSTKDDIESTILIGIKNNFSKLCPE